MTDSLLWITLFCVIAAQFFLTGSLYLMLKKIELVLHLIKKLDRGMGLMQSKTFSGSALALKRRWHGNEDLKASSGRGDQLCK